MRYRLNCAIAVLMLGFSETLPAALFAAEPPGGSAAFIGQYCAGCHDEQSKRGGLNLESLPFEPESGQNFETSR